MEGYQCQKSTLCNKRINERNAVSKKKNAVFCKRSLKYPA